jgi:phage repressor protein C with HTH and peptisase S24 domain
MVELIPLKASAGYTRGYSDPEYIEQLPKMRLPFLPTGKHRAFPIKGDSMPPIREGSFVIAKYLERFEDVKLGQTYIIVTREDGLTYKRIMAWHKKEASFELHSDNKLYPPFRVKAEDVLELWEYTCSINMSQYKEDELNLDSIMNMLRSLKVEIAEIKRSGKSS